MQPNTQAPKLIMIGGPTASGKSALALLLAEALREKGQQAEILCADSITVYRGFDIGSAKPTEEERARVPHHLLDIADPEENFTAADFVRHADPLIQKMLARGTTPIVAGGTGFYLRALLRGMAGGNQDPEKAAAIKRELEKKGENEGWDLLYSELLAQDPGSASIIHPQDHYRIVRALQAMELEGKPWSELNRLARSSPPRFPHRYFKLLLEKEKLKKRVSARTEAMLAQGLVAEVEGLLARGIPETSKPMQSVGYKETLSMLKGEIPPEELAPAITQSTLKLAKQQNTWFRGEELAEALVDPPLPSLLSALD